ncbi:unnamed protein product [Allacma fusca]|uniref:Nuclease HARBI1 n=1 Tax=Allacma fusca TaxID=39272 RepID=A0A8J2PXK8_9HEXA|nr:unnamed protein product [Allacma fusca]
MKVKRAYLFVSHTDTKEEQYHHKYFRMDKDQFDFILDKIAFLIYHSPTHLRPISLRDRLAVTLRFVATGMKQIYLAMSYRISPSSIATINSNFRFTYQIKDLVLK